MPKRWDDPTSDPLTDISRFAARARKNYPDVLADALKDADLSIHYTRVYNGEHQRIEVAAYQPECVCYQTPEKDWFRYGSSVEPGSQWELNPACYVHNEAEAPYYNDPLNINIPVAWSAQCCDCEPGSHHEVNCPLWPDFATIASRLDFDPRWIWPHDPWGKGSRRRYICRSSHFEHHRLGEINGPEHWCERERRVVEEGE